MRAVPGLVSPLRTDKTSMSDQTIPSAIGPSGVVTVQRAMIMSGDFLEMSSQLVKGKMATANALPATASNPTAVVDVFMFI